MFIWLHWVLVARLLSSCGARAEEHGGSVVVVPELSCPAGCGILVPWSRIKPVSPALEGGLLTTGPGKSPYQFLSHLLFVQIKSYINPSVKPITKKKKKIGKQSCFFWKEAGWESGDPGPPSSTCESSQDSSEHTYFSGRHSPAPRLLLTPLRANGPRDIAKFTHLDGRPLGRSEFLASVPRFSLPHSSTLLNWYLSFFRRKHTRIQRFLKSVVFFCFNTTNSELLRTLPLSQMFSSCVLGGGLQVELGLQVTGAWQSVVHNDLKIRFHWS